MAKDKTKLEKPVTPSNVVALSTQCLKTECKSKPSRAGFCNEHFLWFKEGLLTKTGEPCRDFDKKFRAFQLRKSA